MRGWAGEAGQLESGQVAGQTTWLVVGLLGLMGEVTLCRATNIPTLARGQ